MASALAAFRSSRTAEIETLSQRDLLVRLFQGAERFLIQARFGIENDNNEMVNNGCQKARHIFAELLSTLNFEKGGPIAGNLRDLYIFLINQISEVNLHKDAALVDRIVPIVRTLREGWESVPEEQANVSSLPAGHQGHALSLKT